MLRLDLSAVRSREALKNYSSTLSKRLKKADRISLQQEDPSSNPARLVDLPTDLSRILTMTNHNKPVSKKQTLRICSDLALKAQQHDLTLFQEAKWKDLS